MPCTPDRNVVNFSFSPGKPCQRWTARRVLHREITGGDEKRMIHSIISDRAKQWAGSSGCPVRGELDYIRRVGRLRPVQVDAVETYLFLKIDCRNRPLHEIFVSGRLNTLVPDSLRVSHPVRDYLASHPDALALLQFASQPVEEGRGVFAPALKTRIEEDPQSIDASAVFRNLFYGVSYTDYLFSLPMGAGKTFLMAAFIYLDLAFALQEPENPAFARNFLVLAPSGLKSSIVPSLRTIQSFDPSWVVAEPLASRLRRQLQFMVLDAVTSASRSNRVRNPNVQKLASLQPFDDLAGLVAVTNAEKVILDRLDDDQPELFARTEDERAAAANELRATIAKIPALSIFIDEAHHTPSRNQASKLSGEAASEVKLRRVVSQWAVRDSVRTVLGFSGTPYLASPERISVAEGLEIKTSEIANTVHYFPLVDGIGGFLKKPCVQIVRDAPDSLAIVERGIAEFFDRFRDKRYSSGACAKLAVYCGTIARLETQILPLAVRLCEERGIDPVASILRYHRGDRAFPAPEGAELAFAALDAAHSTVRIILLVQIGKEGWDCRSLAGVVLSQEGDCPTNMVMQTSCRCLRAPDFSTQRREGAKENPGGLAASRENRCGEEAVIVLNESNGRQLAEQLKKQQHATLDEFQRGIDAPVRLERFDRTKTLRLPDLPFFQLRVSYGAEIRSDGVPAVERLRALLADLPSLRRRTEIATGTFDDLVMEVHEESAEYEVAFYQRRDAEAQRQGGPRFVAAAYCPFSHWLDLLQKESFGFWKRTDATEEELALLRAIHEKLCVSASPRLKTEQSHFLSPEYDQSAIRARAIAAFWPRRRLSTREDAVPETARLLRVESLVSPLEVSPGAVPSFVPGQSECRRIVDADKGGVASAEAVAKVERQLAAAEADGDADDIAFFRAKLAKAKAGRGVKDRTYHYLPYRTDSAFERAFFDEALRRSELSERDLEIYYNGDSALTGFRIRCYRRLPASRGGGWTSVGQYTPDFLVLHRTPSDKGPLHEGVHGKAGWGSIDACLVVETKGALYARDPAFQSRREFASGEFLRLNASRPGIPRFQYLCLEETADWQRQFLDAIKEFFN